VFCDAAVAYFSAEFGLHESFPIYSGGLGILAGDHIKSASDLDVPLIGIGLFYGQGYFLQRLDKSGWQQEEYLPTNIGHLPMQPAIGTNGEPVVVELQTRSGVIRAKVWRVKVGRCDLLLLDSNVEGNAPEDRDTTSRLYAETRVFASVRNCCWHRRIPCAQAMGISPECCISMKATLVSPSLRQSVTAWKRRLDFYTAASQIPREVIFTTHTPVPAGHDRFSADLIEEHLGILREQLASATKT